MSSFGTQILAFLLPKIKFVILWIMNFILLSNPIQNGNLPWSHFIFLMPGVASNGNSFIRPLKIGLLLLTGYTYSSAVQANRRLGNSIYGLNASGRQEAFQRRNQEFIVSSMLTSTVFLGSSIIAYIRFGRDSDWNDLRIPGRTEITIDDLQQRVLNHSSGRWIELSYEKRF